MKTGTALGANNEVSEAAVLGGKPQHLYAGDEAGALLIGNDNVIREYAANCAVNDEDEIKRFKIRQKMMRLRQRLSFSRCEP